MKDNIFLIHSKPTEIRMAVDLISNETGERYLTHYCNVSEIDLYLQSIDRDIFTVGDITITNNAGRPYKNADAEGNMQIMTKERRA
jgi:hypothetical protein